MTTFDQREQAFENKFVHDDTMLFKARAHSLRALGRWAAGKIGQNADQAAAYGESLVVTEIEKPGGNEVFWRIRRDFDAAGLVAFPDADIRKTMDDLLAKSVADLRQHG
jgi:hypothetical protein